MKKTGILLLALVLTVALCGCSSNADNDGTATTAPTTATTAPTAADDPLVTTFTAKMEQATVRVDLKTPEGYLAGVNSKALTLPAISDAKPTEARAFLPTGEIEKGAPQYTFRLSHFAEESNAYIVQLTARFYPASVYSAIRKDTTWSAIGDITAASGLTYSAFRAGSGYYLVALLDGTDLCVIIDTAENSDAINHLTLTVI